MREGSLLDGGDKFRLRALVRVAPGRQGMPTGGLVVISVL
jgi:hypothetical protein